MTNKVKVTSEVKKLGVWNKLPSDSVNSSKIQFEFDEEWKDLVCTAQFTQGEHTYNVLITDNKCIIPSELTEGSVEISVFGVKEDGTAFKATTVPLVEDIVKSGFVGNGDTPIPPTPDLYNQLINAFSTNEGYDVVLSGIGYTTNVNVTNSNYKTYKFIQEQGARLVQYHAVLPLMVKVNNQYVALYQPLNQDINFTHTNLTMYYDDNGTETSQVLDTELSNDIKSSFTALGANYTNASFDIFETNYEQDDETIDCYGIDINVRASGTGMSLNWEQVVETINNIEAFFNNATRFTFYDAPQDITVTLSEV